MDDKTNGAQGCDPWLGLVGSANLAHTVFETMTTLGINNCWVLHIYCVLVGTASVLPGGHRHRPKTRHANSQQQCIWWMPCHKLSHRRIGEGERRSWEKKGVWKGGPSQKKTKNKQKEEVLCHLRRVQTFSWSDWVWLTSYLVWKLGMWDGINCGTVLWLQKWLTRMLDQTALTLNS